MLVKGYTKLLLVLMSFLLSSAAIADMSLPYGWYIEGNVGSTDATNKSYNGQSSSSGIGGNANIGYKFMPYLAAEMGYTQYANASISDQNGTRAGTDKRFAVDLAAKGIVPIATSGAEVFAKLGVQRLYSKTNVSNDNAAARINLTNSTDSHTGAYLGVGGQYSFMPEFAVNVQWARAVGDSSTGTMSLLSAGLSFMLY